MDEPSPRALRTNRDLYLRVDEVVRAHRDRDRSLASYLRALRAAVRAGAHGETLSLDELAALLAAAFEATTGDGAQGDDDPASEALSPARRPWEARLAAQLADLDAMAADGSLDDDQRYFGLDAPSGARWYNFDPCGYLECAVAGTFGGWEPDDDTGRVEVSGLVATLDPATGALTAVPAASLRTPVAEVPTIDWATFTAFLEDGAHYE